MHVCIVQCLGTNRPNTTSTGGNFVLQKIPLKRSQKALLQSKQIKYSCRQRTDEFINGQMFFLVDSIIHS